ncbi:MAG TPA: hypothetical protein VF789_21030 [Thermoanaerobaculia bacterium]
MKRVLVQAAWMALLAAAYVWLGRSVLTTGLVDDSYIFLRYAENLAAGQGPVFNPGERVEGYTSPLWVLVLAGAKALGMDLVPASQALGACFGLATLLLLAILGRRWLPPEQAALAAVPALFLLTNPSFLYWTWSGMDTALFTFLFLATFAAFAGRAASPGNMAGAGACFALAVLCRPDGIVLLPVLCAILAWLHRRQPRLLVRKLLTFLAPLALVALHLAWRLSYYGMLLPNTYFAKVDLDAGVRLWNGLRYTFHFVLAYGLYLLALPVAILGPLAIVRRGPRTWVAPALAVLSLWAVYVTAVGGDHFGLFRFYVPVLPLIAALAVLWAGHLLPGGDGSSRARAAAVALALVLSLTAINYSAYVSQVGRFREEIALAQAWAEVGRWLGANAPKGSTVALIPVGAVPYYSGLNALDLLGLTDREISRHGKVDPAGRVGHQKYDTEYVLARRPDYILSQSSGLFPEPLLRRDPSIARSYPRAFSELFFDERVRRLYDYRAIRMNNGRYIELLQRRGSRLP